jgi:hypothetical protein
VPANTMPRQSHIEIRQSRLIRAMLIAFGIAWCALLAVIVAIALPAPITIVPVLMIAAGALFLSRLATLSVVTDDGELVIRNVYRTWRVPRGAVSGFRLGRDTATPMGYMVFALTDSEIVSLDVSRAPTDVGRARDQLAALQAWLGESPTGG